MGVDTDPTSAERSARRVAPARCPNCGARVDDAYCPRCGQARLSRYDLSLRRLLTEVVRGFTNLESGLLGTLRALLLRPGFLTLEWLRGRRRRYVGPVQLYITATVFFFAFDALLHHAGWQRQFAPGGLFAALVQRLGVSAEAITQSFSGAFSEYTTWLRVASVLLSALVLRWLFWRRRLLYVEHAVFALHYGVVEWLISGAFAGGVVLWSWLAGREPPGWAALVVYLAGLPYLVAALRRVYGERWPATVAKAVVLLACQYLLYGGVIVAAIAIAAARR